MLFATNMHIASGIPYLKRESWYRDLLKWARSSDEPPFALELLNEGRDALERENFRLAAINFALSVEALFRKLLLEYFEDEDVTRPAEDMMGTYFRRYREIAKRGTLPFRKRKAQRLFEQVWAPRDQLMHGHDLDLTAQDVRLAETAALQLFELWQDRPGGTPIIVEGPFAAGSFEKRADRDFPPNDADEMFDRAVARYNGGNMRDAEEAARYTLQLDPSHADAVMLLGVIAFKRDELEPALEWFERAASIRPGFAAAKQNAERVKELISGQEGAGGSA